MRNPTELVIPFEGYEIVLPESAIDARYVAVGFHDDGRQPYAVAGDTVSIAKDVMDFDGGWVLMKMFT